MAEDKGREGDAEPEERPRLPGMLKAVAHYPDLLEPFLDFATVISHNGALSKRDSELLAMRVAWNCQSEWAKPAERVR